MRFRHLFLTGTLALAVPATLLAAGPRYGTWGVDRADMDTKVKPGDSLFEFAEGTWLRRHAIPADKTGAGYNYELPDEIELQVRKMVEDVSANPTSPIAKKIGDAYAAWMDEAGIEARGLAPLRPYLARISAVSSRAQLVKLMMEPGYASPVNVESRPTRTIPRATPPPPARHVLVFRRATITS